MRENPDDDGDREKSAVVITSQIEISEIEVFVCDF